MLNIGIVEMLVFAGLLALMFFGAKYFIKSLVEAYVKVQKSNNP
ncbi:MAG: hypothetical protein RLZZ156_2101 [Deinococcota bacterium]|jgi:hypothetical protein